MDLTFFRMMFRSNNRGITHTFAYQDEVRNTSCHVMYISEGGSEKEDIMKSYPVDILLLGDYKSNTLERAERVMKFHPVTTVVFPQLPVGKRRLLSLYKMLGAESVLHGDGTIDTELVRISYYTTGRTLNVYHDFEFRPSGTEKEISDCAMNAKVFHKSWKCIPNINHEGDHCEYGCLRKKDFMILDRHKREGHFCTGTLILGKDAFDQGEEAWDRMMKKLSVEKGVRAVLLPVGLEAEKWKRISWKLEVSQVYQYYLAVSSRIDREIAGEIVTASPYYRYVPMDENYGLCISGYFVWENEEKRC